MVEKTSQPNESDLIISEEPPAPALDEGLFAERLTHSFPAVFHGTPNHTGMRLAEFFAAHIRNPNTRAAYLQAVCQFLEWAESKKFGLMELNPFRIAGYVEILRERAGQRIERARQSRKGRQGRNNRLCAWSVICGKLVSATNIQELVYEHFDHAGA